MTSKLLLRLLTVAGIGPLLASPALADDDSYFYGGLSVGQSHGRLDAPSMGSAVLGTGLSVTDATHDDRDMAYKLFGGYQFNRYLGLEGGYFRLGTFGFNANTTPLGTLEGQARVQGLNLDLVGSLPLSERWSALARVGAQYARTRDSFGAAGGATVTSTSLNQNETNYKAGVGLQYAFTPSVLVRGEVERYRVNDAASNHLNVNMYSVSLVFPFGRTSTPAPRMVMAPAYVAPAPMPPPAAVVEPVPAPVVAPPAPAPLRRVSFTAESLFGFDKSAIQPDGRGALDKFVRELDGTRFDMINVEGHTDRLGTETHNQTLSQQRADAVKAYLVDTGHVDAAKVASIGKSESTPITKPEDCKGQQANARLIACLQPDRRVEIEVVGTR